MTASRFERILCATDFSPFSGQALRHALALARRFEARLKLVYVIPHVYPGAESMYGAAPWLMTPEVRTRAEEDLKAFALPLREARWNHELEVREGDPWREVADAAVEMQADLVVMGTHGRSGFDRYLLGSVAEKLVRRLPCSVLTVSHEEGHTWSAPGLLKKLLCATDFSPAAEEAGRTAAAIAAHENARLPLVHVVEDAVEFGDPTYLSVGDVGPARQEVERAAEGRLSAAAEVLSATADVETRLAFGRPHREIVRMAAEEAFDLIVIGAQGHGFLEHMLAGSTAPPVIRGATCPVLTVRPKKARAASGERGLALSPQSNS